jgi:hypothetical protein
LVAAYKEQAAAREREWEGCDEAVASVIGDQAADQCN